MQEAHRVPRLTSRFCKAALVLGICLGIVADLRAATVAKAARRAGEQRQLLAAGDFERTAAERVEGWAPYDGGYELVRTGGRTGTTGILCNDPEGSHRLGASQTLTLDRIVGPLVVSGWSRAEDVTGSPTLDYSIYVDIVYTDGTPLWACVAMFPCGTHDWERRQVRIMPDKPIRTMTVYALFRGRQGKVWFDDLAVWESPIEPSTVVFEEVGVEPRGAGEAVADAPAEIHIRDAAAEGDFVLVPDAGASSGPLEIAELQVEVGVRRTKSPSGVDQTDITVIDLAGRDRAISIYYIVPIDAIGWRWFDNVREHRTISQGMVYHNAVRTGVGLTGLTSRCPFACVAGEDRARSLLVTEPSVCYLGYHAGTHELYARFDVGLAAETKKPRTAYVSICDAKTDPRWGLRDTARLYYELLPRYFNPARTPKRQGNWMPFQAISSVQEPDDFHFAVHEGDNDVRWDNDHGVQPFVYIEPMTFWMPMPREMPRTYAAAMEYLRSFQKDASSSNHDVAWAVDSSALFDADGRHHLDLLDAPWCDGAVFGNSADPDVREPAGRQNLAHHNVRILEQALNRAKPHGGLAGVYLDSLEGWGRLLNHRREHFAAADLPLTFDAETRRPVILNAMATQEWTEFMAEWLHRQDKLLMANAVPHEFPFLALPLDVLGTETNWQQDGRFAPPGADFLYLKRTLSWHKPYMFLMNTHFETWTAEMTERYMQWCLFLGMFPGFFSENAATDCYFQNPAWYNRDRPLFRKYMPIIRRVAEAGWEPITLATAMPDDVWVERWGTRAESGLYFTVINTTDQLRQAKITLDDAVGTSGVIKTLLQGERSDTLAGIKIDLAANGLEVLELLPP